MVKNSDRLLLVSLFCCGLIPSVLSSGKDENVFRALKKDEACEDPVLVISVKRTTTEKSNIVYSGGEVLFTCGPKVYSFPLISREEKTQKNNGVIESEFISSCIAQPGNYELVSISFSARQGNYISSTNYAFHGTFTLAKGTLNYLGEISYDLPTSQVSLESDAGRFKKSGELFGTQFPGLFASAGSKLSVVRLGDPQPFTPATTLFEDDFKSGPARWRMINDNLHSAVIEDGSLIIHDRAKDSAVVSTDIPLPDGFDVELDISWIGGDENKSFGLLIGNDIKHCLKFNLTSSGYYSVTRCDFSKAALAKAEKMFSPEVAEPWKKSAIINTGAGKTNHLRIQKTGWYQHTVGIIAFYLNDKLLCRNFYLISPAGFGSTQFDKNGVLGLFCYGKQQVSFSKLKYSALN